MGYHTLSFSQPHICYVSVMTHISILQSEDKPSSPQIPPHSLLVLRKASTSSESPAQALKQFIADKGHQDLGNLREPLAAEAADLLDEVRKPIITTLLSCSQGTSL